MADKNEGSKVIYVLHKDITETERKRRLSMLEKSSSEFFNILDVEGTNKFYFSIDNVWGGDNGPILSINVSPQAKGEIVGLVPKFKSPLKRMNPLEGHYSSYHFGNFIYNVHRYQKSFDLSSFDFLEGSSK